MVAERGRGWITALALVTLGCAAVAAAAAMEVLAERFRFMESDVTRYHDVLAERVRIMDSEVTKLRDVLAENENLRQRLGAGDQRLAPRSSSAHRQAEDPRWRLQTGRWWTLARQTSRGRSRVLTQSGR